MNVRRLMHCAVVFILASTQAFSGQTSVIDGNIETELFSPSQFLTSSQTDREYLRGALQMAEKRVEYDHDLSSTSGSERDSTTQGRKTLAVDLQYDDETLQHVKDELAKCLAWNERAATKPGPTKDCASSEFSEIRVVHAGQPIHEVQLWRQRHLPLCSFEILEDKSCRITPALLG